MSLVTNALSPIMGEVLGSKSVYTIHGRESTTMVGNYRTKICSMITMSGREFNDLIIKFIMFFVFNISYEIFLF